MFIVGALLAKSINNLFLKWISSSKFKYVIGFGGFICFFIQGFLISWLHLGLSLKRVFALIIKNSLTKGGYVKE